MYTADLTLNFDLELSKVNIETQILNNVNICFTDIGLVLFGESERTNKQTNKQTRVITIPPGIAPCVLTLYALCQPELGYKDDMRRQHVLVG